MKRVTNNKMKLVVVANPSHLEAVNPNSDFSNLYKCF